MSGRKKMISAVLATMMAILVLSACGRKESSTPAAEVNQNVDDMVYEGSVVTIEGLTGKPAKADYVYKNERLYFMLEQEVNGERDKKTRKLYSVNLDGSNPEEIPLNVKENEYIDTFDVDADGNYVYLLRNTEKVTDYDGMEVCSADLVKAAGDGTETARIDCDSFLNKKKYEDVYDFTLDAKGNVVLSGENMFFFLDADFENVEKKKAIGMDYVYSGLIPLEDGTFLCSGGSDSEEDVKFARMNIEERAVEMADNIRLSEFVLNLFPGFGDYDFCYSTQGGIYGYSMDGNVSTGIMDFLGTGIDLNPRMISMGDGRFLEMETNEEDAGCSFVVYTKRENSQADGRRKIYYGTIGIEQDVKDAIIEFNRNNENYRIVIKDYLEEEDPITKMNLDIAAGDVPDIIDLAVGSADQYISKGLVEDLTPYLENDSEIGEEDFIPSVLEAIKTDGKIYYVAPAFLLSTLVGRESDVGTGTGWTFEEFNDLLASKPDDVRPFPSYNQVDILASLLDAGESDYIDWQAGTCSFDSPNYKNMLKIAKERGEAREYNYEENEDEAEEIMNGKILFNSGFVALDDIQIYDFLYGGDYKFIGYPNSERDGSYYFFPMQLGIYSNSDNKEGAWEFVRTFLTKEYQGLVMSEMNAPTRQDCFDLMIEGAMSEKEYVNAVGKEVHPRDEECYIGKTSIKLGPLSQEQADAYVDLVKRTRKVGCFDDPITDILLEEAQNYFNGKNSLEEAVKYTQNRVSTYVNEKK